MSREGLKDFVHAVEHSAALRRQVLQANVPHHLVNLATAHGFAVSEKDLNDDLICTELQSWFDRSWIQPSHQS
jgi:predicted ribosomally synthesized peptide with nif11-like leader